MTERALSFGEVPDDYDRFRPGPPAAVLDWLLPAGAADVVDVGAGTGALTRLLVARRAAVTAVEPDPRMRAVLADRVPEAVALEGTGEALPVADATADAVLASSSWHWVDPARGVAEAARVLRPGGILGVVWSSVDRSVGWADELWRALRPGHVAPTRGRAPRRLEIPTASAAAFAPVEGPWVARSVRRLTRDELVGLAGTYSGMIVRPPEERAALLDAVRAALDADPRLADPEGVEVPYVSRCWRARRLCSG